MRCQLLPVKTAALTMASARMRLRLVPALQVVRAFAVLHG